MFKKKPSLCVSYQKGEKRPDSGQKGVVAQSVEPWIPEKTGVGARAWVRVPPTP